MGSPSDTYVSIPAGGYWRYVRLWDALRFLFTGRRPRVNKDRPQ